MQLDPPVYDRAGLPGFQYPRSDRRRCNRLKETERRRQENPFSILGRIGGDATDAEETGRWHAGCAFSILGRIGGDATLQV